MRTMKLACVLVGALALGGCPSTGGGNTSNKTTETRAYVLDRCPGATPPQPDGTGKSLQALGLPLAPAIATAVIPALIDVSLDLLASAVREAAKDKTDGDSAITTTYLHSFPVSLSSAKLAANPNFGCIAVVRGIVESPTRQNQPSKPTQSKLDEPNTILAWARQFTDVMQNYANRQSNPKYDLDSIDKFITSVGIGSSDKSPVHFYFAAKIEFSSEASAFRLVPVDYWQHSYIGRGGSPEVVLNLAISSARSPRDGTPIAIATLPLPKLEQAGKVDAKFLDGSASGWISFPNGDTVAKETLGSLQQLYDSWKDAENAGKKISDQKDCDSEIKKLAVITNLDDIIKLRTADDRCHSYFMTIQRAALEMLTARSATRNDATDRVAAALAVSLARSELAQNYIRDQTAAGKKDELKKEIEKVHKLQPPLTPVTIQVDIIENRKGSPFMKAIADVLDKSKKGVGDALVASLSPAERAKRRAEEEQQTRTNRAAVATAEDNVRLRQAELDDLPATATRAERVRAENALRQAKIAANNAYLADGRGVPYPEVQP